MLYEKSLTLFLNTHGSILQQAAADIFYLLTLTRDDVPFAEIKHRTKEDTRKMLYENSLTLFLNTHGPILQQAAAGIFYLLTLTQDDVPFAEIKHKKEITRRIF